MFVFTTEVVKRGNDLSFVRLEKSGPIIKGWSYGGLAMHYDLFLSFDL